MHFDLFIPVLGGYIAYSISERAGLTAGLVAGAMAKAGGSGFLGALAGGFLAGYVVKFLVKALANLPKSLNGLKNDLVLSCFICFNDRSRYGFSIKSDSFNNKYRIK